MILWTAPFGTLVFRGISDKPSPTLKRLTISFLALQGKGLLVPCIRRQRFTRIVKAPKRISCHLELGNLNIHVLIMCKPNMYTATHRSENLYRYKIVAVVVYIFYGFPIKPRNFSQRISCLVKILLWIFFLRITVVDFLFTGYFCRLYVLAIFLRRAQLENNENITRDIPENWAKKTNFSVLFGKFELLLRRYKKKFEWPK